MSVKRQATTELNHDNWDQEDSTEPEEMGTFKTASKEVLEKRVIKTAKRRTQISNDESKKSVFSGFGGFNKVQQSSFDFLANLTNGNKSNNGEATTKSDTPISSSVFTNKSLSSSQGTGLFSMSGSTGFTPKPATTKSEGSLFGSSTTNTATPIKSVFSTTKADSTVSDNPFKLQQASSTSGGSDLAAKTSADVPKPQSSSIFGAQSDSSSNKTLFGSSTEKSKLFSMSITNTSLANNIATSKAETNTPDTKSKPDQSEEKKLRYYSKLKGLNESVSDWIKKHVEETPLCILTPIFQDYEKYLKEIQEEYKGGEKNIKDNENKVESKQPSTEMKHLPANSNASPTIFGNINTNSPKTEITQKSSTVENKTSSFSFGVNNSAVSTTANKGFSFGIKSVQSTASSIFSVSTTSTTSASTPFSFGINNTAFSFNPTNPQKTEATPEANEEDDEPPKVEYTPIVEENSVFDKKCKIFIKKDGNFVDKGVGTLYIKKIEDSGKHQLLVRANTNLGTILLNFILSSSIPTQRMGKNNVMLVCIPTPDAKPPPTPILIRVKTTEEADELLTTLDKYKA